MKRFFSIILSTIFTFQSLCGSGFGYDPRIKLFEEHQTFEMTNPDVIFAGVDGLAYRCYKEQSLDFKTYGKSAFQWMLDLKYDLDVAENQCNWLAKEMVSKELLETIGGKYGLSKLDKRDDSEVRQRIIDNQNMIALHAAMASEQIAEQRKTTELCQKHLGKDKDELKKGYQEGIGNPEDLHLDQNLQDFLEEVDPDSEELEVKRVELEYSGNGIEEIRDLGDVISNPEHAENIYIKTWEIFLQGDLKSERAAEVYAAVVRQYVEETFDFGWKAVLKSLAENYFLKLYDKLRILVQYNKSNLELIDCGSRDIYGNDDVCSYNALLELIRRNPDNESFISVGGMLSKEELKELNTKQKTDQTIARWCIPYKKFTYRSSYIAREYIPEDAFYEHDDSLILMPTNDLSSRARAHASYLVSCHNKNRYIRKSNLLKKRVEITITQNLPKFLKQNFKLAPVVDTVHEKYGLVRQNKVWIPKSVIEATNPYVFSEGKIYEDYQTENHNMHIYSSFGLNFSYFYNAEEADHPVYIHWPDHTVLNKLTTKESYPFIKIALVMSCIHNPFSTLVGALGLDRHRRLISQ